MQKKPTLHSVIVKRTKLNRVKNRYRDRVSNDGFIYTPFITVRGRVIYHPTGGVFKFLPKSI